MSHAWTLLQKKRIERFEKVMKPVGKTKAEKTQLKAAAQSILNSMEEI